MRDKVFLDTNILVYLYSETEPEKRQIAIDNMKRYICFTSTQAINEFSNVLSGKWKLSSSTVKQAILQINSVCEIVINDLSVIYHALELREKYKFSFFDTLMLSSAILNNCDYIFSEVMHDGQKIAGLEIINIFKRGNF